MLSYGTTEWTEYKDPATAGGQKHFLFAALPWNRMKRLKKDSANKNLKF